MLGYARSPCLSQDVKVLIIIPFLNLVINMICRNADNSWEPGKIHGCQLDFPGLISPRGLHGAFSTIFWPTAQITAYQVQNIPAVKIFNNIPGFVNSSGMGHAKKKQAEAYIF